jgi:uncharacterized BrkB/YihY/UPF0761 family membrane protein
MSSARRVPETRLLGGEELSADHAWRALRRYGGWRLLRDALVRFRAGDGFSHARALGLQLCLGAVPLLIALNGLASKLGGLRRAGRVVADTVLALTPGASESLVRQLLAHEERVRDSGQVALSLGLLTAVVALITAVGQVERGANRIYGVDQDRPRWYHWDSASVTTWNIARWPVSLGLTVVTVSVLFRYAPRRRQPGLSWLMVGAGLATALWWLVSLVLAAYAAESREFGTTYGPLTGVMALLLWANLTGIALFVGVAFAAQLEARRVGISGSAVADQDRSLEERAETTPTSRP